MRLIDADAAIDEINKYGSVWMEYTEDMTKDKVAEEALKNAKASMKRIIRELPSAQPEIVRCKDCKHYQEDHLFKVGFCDGRQRNNDDFCSRAERKTDETD